MVFVLIKNGQFNPDDHPDGDEPGDFDFSVVR
jgi:hypothetical protein